VSLFQSNDLDLAERFFVKAPDQST